MSITFPAEASEIVMSSSRIIASGLTEFAMTDRTGSRDGRTANAGNRGCTENSAVVHMNVCSPATLSKACSKTRVRGVEPSVAGDEHRARERGKGLSDRDVEPRALCLTRGPAHSRS
jgi:hypothetical protein